MYLWVGDSHVSISPPPAGDVRRALLKLIATDPHSTTPLFHFAKGAWSIPDPLFFSSTSLLYLSNGLSLVYSKHQSIMTSALK